MTTPDAPAPRTLGAYLRQLDRRFYGWLAASFGIVVVATRILPFQVPYPLDLFEAYAAYALLPVWPALVYARVRKLKDLTAVCLFLALAHVGWVFDFVPRRLFAEPLPEQGTPLRLLTANLLAPAGSEIFAREIRDADADVIVASELSDRWSELFRSEGVYPAYPHIRANVIPSYRSYFGIGVLSRFPITDHRFHYIDTIPLVQVDLDVQGSPVRLYAFHAFPPTTVLGFSVWRRQLALLEELIDADREAGRRVILTGDFNTTTMTRGYRRLLATGLTSAHEAAGRPFAITWPNGLWTFPPVRIDHVFLRGVGVRSIREGVGDGSDHIPIVSELIVPE